MAPRRTIWDLIVQRARQSPAPPTPPPHGGAPLAFPNPPPAAAGGGAGRAPRGAGPGTTVVWQLPNWPDALIVAAALARLQVVQVPLMPAMGAAGVGFVCRQVRAELLLTPQHWNGCDYAAMAAEVSGRLPSLRTLVIRPGDAGIAGALAAGGSLPPFAPVSGEVEAQVRWVFYTSGTTADPKGALHSDEALIATAFGMTAVLELAGDDVVPLVFPVTHIGGFIWLVSFLLSGCECLLIEKFSAAVVPLLRRHGVTVAGAGVPFAQTYLREQDRTPATPILPQLRCVTGGGSTRPASLHHEVRTRLGGVGYISGYGLTECPIAAMNTVRDPDDRLATAEGRPLPGMEVRIRAADGRPVPVGEQGVIWLRGPHRCKGYVDAALDAEAFDAEGFFNSGDLGYLDADGWLTVSGRVKDIIIRKGQNISARKVEDVLRQHPAIADIAVIALPDGERGEMACAVIEPSNPVATVTLPELGAFGLERGLMRHEIPERIELVAVLPYSASGKILKEQLRQQFAP